MKARLFLVACAAVLGAWGLSWVGPGHAAAPPRADPGADVQDVVVLGDAGPALLRLRVRLDGKPLRTAWADAINKIFDYLDADGDGVLGAKEAARVPTARALFNLSYYGDFKPPSPATLDGDKDGRVSRAELADYYARAGATPVQFRFGPGSQGFERTLVRLIDATQGRPSAAAVNKRLFTLLDADKDGKLSKKELVAAPKLLAKADADDDEMVTLPEVMGTSNPNATDDEEGFSELASNSDGGSAPSDASDGLFYLVAPGGPDKALAKLLLARYGVKGAKALTRKAGGLTKDVFDRLDADGDGRLDAEELARFAQRPPDAEVAVRLGTEGTAVEVVKAPGAALAEALKPVKGGVELALGITRVTLAGPEPTGGVWTTLAFEVRNLYEASFKAADKDGNGYLDAKEARGQPFFGDRFTQMDRDGDGMLYLKEALAYHDAMATLERAAAASFASLSVSDQGRGLFDLLDADNNGRLTVRELRAFAKVVGALDRDGDGAVSPREVPRHYRASFARGTPGGAYRVRFDAFDGSLRASAAPPERREGPVWFHKMDRNRDGDVSRKEFLGTDAQFQRIDADGDGLISPKEAAAFDERLRKATKKKG